MSQICLAFFFVGGGGVLNLYFLSRATLYRNARRYRGTLAEREFGLATILRIFGERIRLYSFLFVVEPAELKKNNCLVAAKKALRVKGGMSLRNGSVALLAE